MGYKLRSLAVPKFNKVKKTRHSIRVVHTIPGANFCPPRDIWRGLQSCMEKRRRREAEVTRRRRGGIKRGKSKLASNQFPMCSPQLGPLREVHRVI